MWYPECCTARSLTDTALPGITIQGHWTAQWWQDSLKQSQLPLSEEMVSLEGSDTVSDASSRSSSSDTVSEVFFKERTRPLRWIPATLEGFIPPTSLRGDRYASYLAYDLVLEAGSNKAEDLGPCR